MFARLGYRFLAAILLAAIAASPTLAGEERVALLIGNGAYTDTTQLRNPPNDVTDMARALERLGFEVLLVVNGDKLTIERGIRAFGELLTGADVGLFFYAGHGLQVNGRNYIVPTNARLAHERDLLFEAIDVGLPVSIMEQSGVRVSLIILDACRDNPLAGKLASTIRSTGRSTRVGRGLTGIDGARGTLIAYAAAPGDIAADGDGRNSPFTSGERYAATGKVNDDKTFTFVITGGDTTGRGKGKFTGTEAKGSWDAAGACNGTLKLKKVS